MVKYNLYCFSSIAFICCHTRLPLIVGGWCKSPAQHLMPSV